MNRLRRFFANAGTPRLLQTLVVLLLMISALRRDAASGDWVVTVPILLSLQLLAFLIRNILVADARVASWTLNGLLIALLVTMFILRGAGPEPLWMRATLAGALSFYMGCAFWMLSDDRIAVRR